MNDAVYKATGTLENGTEDYTAILQPGKAYAYVMTGGEAVAGSAGYAVGRLVCRSGQGRYCDMESLVFHIYSARGNRQARNRPTSYRMVLMENRTKAELLISAQESRINVEGFSRNTSLFIEKIEETRLCDWLLYTITFACPVQTVLRELDGPGRIIIEITRGGDGIVSNR